MKSRLLLAVLFFFCISAKATTWYISPTGNDVTGNGTASNPWKTLYKATQAVSASGDIIHVTTGTYLETQQCTLKVGVSIEGDDSTNTIIKSTVSAPYVELLNCESPTGTNGNQHISTIKFDGQFTNWWIIYMSGRSNFIIHDCSFVNAKIQGVTMTARSDNAEGYPSTYSTGNRFYNNTMYNCGNWDVGSGNGYGNFAFGGQKDMLIYNNTITENNTPYNNGWPIKYWSGGYNLGTKIYNNTLNAKLQNFTLGDQNWDFAIEMFNATGMEIYNNTFNNGCVDFNNSSSTGFNTGYGMSLVAGYGYSLWIHNNTFACATIPSHIQTGITLEYSVDSVIIENNTFDKFNLGVLYTPRPGSVVSNIEIRHNLFTDLAAADGEGYGVDFGVYSGNNLTYKNINLYNNTFLSYMSNPIYFGVKLPNNLLTGSAKRINIKNNIFTGMSSAPLYVHEGTIPVDSLDVEYNSFYNTGNNNVIRLNGTAPMPTHFTFANNVNINPIFGAGYALVTGTALVDAGINVGLPYSGSAPDINWTDSTTVPPPVVCNSFNPNRLGSGMTLLNSGQTVRKAQYPDASAIATASSSTGKVCWKVIIDSLDASILYNFSIGIANDNTLVNNMIGGTNNEYALREDGTMFHNGFFNGSSTASYKQGDTLLLALDLTGAGSLKFYKKAAGAWVQMPQVFTAITAGAWYPAVGASQVGFKASINLSLSDTLAGYPALCQSQSATNIPPTANAGPDQTITLPTNSVNLTGTGNDPDGTITAYQWTKISGPTTGAIVNPNSATTAVTTLVAGTYQFELKVTDNSGATGKDTMQVTVNPGAVNIPPTANAGPDQTITLPTSSVNLTGSGIDPDGTITAYLWTKIAGPTSGTIANPTAAITSVNGLVAGVYSFELKVTDNNGATGRDTMQVTVNAAANIPPTANAGPDQTITLPTNSVSLTGTGNDPDGTIVSYQWTKVAGPIAGTITNPTAAATTVTGLTAGVYKFELKVTDNGGATGRDTMQVTVNPAPNIPPTANAGPDQTITLPTNSVNLTGTGNDPDGTVVAYLWTKISGPLAGIIANPTSATTSANSLVAGVYQFELKVTDNNGATGRDTMQVTVNPAPNIPPTANAGPDQTITLPVNSGILTGSGTDPDGTVTAYQWTKVSGPAVGAITNPSSATTAVTGLVAGIYQFELKVTDNNGATGRDTMQVTVNPAPNIPPTANAGPDQSITLPTNSINLTGTGTDPDGTISAYLWTKVSGPAAGTITNAASATTTVTVLVAGIYKFELKVTDNSGATDTDTMQVIVFAPNIPPTANAGLDQSITLPTNTANLSGSGNDVDGTITAYLWTRVSGPNAGTIVNPTSAVTDITGLVAGVYVYQLRVTDNNGATGIDLVQVTVNPENIPPVANAGPDQSIVLPLNTVTLTGTGTDVDGTVVSYKWRQLSGPADKLTTPNTAVTVLTTLIEGVYKFELTVTDNKGATGKDTTTVTVRSVTPPSANSVKVYPNPVVDFANVNILSTAGNTALLVVVTDMQGKNVYTKKLPMISYTTMEKINMSNLASGVYLITVYFNSQEKITIKAIKP